jgi:hypothetical protein
MKGTQIFLRALVIAGTLEVLLAGCAAKREQQAMNTERLLHVAGFQMKIADTPQKFEMLKGMPQRRITPYPRDDKIFYVYADATSCRCIYVGTPEAYQRYVDLRVQQGIVEDNRKAAQANRAAQTQVNWGVWGVWGPWW